MILRNLGGNVTPAQPLYQKSHADNTETHSSVKVRVWPNGAFTIGYEQPLGCDRKPERYEIRTDAYWNGYRWVPFYEVKDKHPYMGLSDATISHKPQKRAKRGSKGITSNAKRTVASAIVLLERAHGLGNLSFVTLTVPTVTVEQSKLINSSWSEIVRQFIQQYTRRLSAAGLSTNYVHVTEIQEKRFHRWGIVAPHLHLLTVGRKSRYSDWAVSKTEVMQLWSRAIAAVTGLNLDCSFATRTEKPRESTKREMAKYLSKGSKTVSDITEAGRAAELPSSWHGVSRALLKAVKASIAVVRGDKAIDFLRQLQQLQRSNVIRYREIFHTLIDHQSGASREVRIGISGWFTSERARMWFLSGSFTNTQLVA